MLHIDMKSCYALYILLEKNTVSRFHCLNSLCHSILKSFYEKRTNYKISLRTTTET